MKNIDESSLIDCSVIKKNTDRLEGGETSVTLSGFHSKKNSVWLTVMRGGSGLIVTNDICNLGISGVLHRAALKCICSVCIAPLLRLFTDVPDTLWLVHVSNLFYYSEIMH